MIGVRAEGCVCEPCSDIPPNWRDMRSELGYIMLAEIAISKRGVEYDWKKHR